MTKILLLQGANLVSLGTREPHLYGTMTAEALDALMRDRAQALGITLDIRYENVEGEAIARIYEAAKAGTNGILMNPAGFTYAGFALRDCIKAVALPYVEVHITNIERRGTRSVLAEVADGVVYGLGVSSYLRGLDGLLDIVGHET